MENSQSQSEPGEEISFEKNISQDFNSDGHSGSYHQTFGKEGSGSAFPHHRLVILSLGLLNAVLLIAAVVIGIYCAKGNNLQVPDSAAVPFMIEMNYLHNHSDIPSDELEALAELARKRTSHLQIKMQVKQTETRNDILQRQIEILQTEKTNLKSNKTILEESCGRCPQGWHLLKSSCYYFSQESNYNKNWPDSRANCISQGGDLVVINNLAEQQLLIAYVPKIKSKVLWWQDGFWIGLTDEATMGTWVWVNNVTELETEYWKSGQPSHVGDQSGNCAGFYNFADPRGRWYNANCLGNLFGWICEMEPS